MLIRAAAGAVVVAGMIATPAPAATLQLGIADQETLAQSAPADQALALRRIADAGGTVVRVGFRWSSIAPVAPPNASEATNPAWSGYHFEHLDQLARAASGAGVRLVPFVTRAPAWAEGPDRPAGGAAPAGTWRPSPGAFGHFATALARRYGGSFRDPIDPTRALPRISAWQVWNEPNLTDELTPAWERSAGRWVPAAAPAYRALLNAFARSVKSVDPAVEIVTAGTAPFGDAPGGSRIPPVTFWRALFCREPGTGPVRRCPTVHFDAFAHHPYPIGPPHRTARNARDVTVPDLGKLAVLVRRAVRDGTAVPRRPKPLWITEISWDSAPDPAGLPLQQQATYLAGAFSILQRAGARVICWFGLRDQAQGGGWARTYQSGLYARGRTLAEDAPKPSLAAFAFPFAAYRANGVALLWGVNPVAGDVRVEAFTSTGWQTVARGTAPARGVFTFRLRAGLGVRLRAIAGDRVSQEWVTS